MKRILLFISAIIGLSNAYVGKQGYITYPQAFWQPGAKGPIAGSTVNVYLIFMDGKTYWNDATASLYVDVVSELKSSLYFTNFLKGLGVTGGSVNYKGYTIVYPAKQAIYFESELNAAFELGFKNLGFDSSALYIALMDPTLQAEWAVKGPSPGTYYAEEEWFNYEFCEKSGIFTRSNGQKFNYFATAVASKAGSLAKNAVACSFSAGIPATSPYLGVNDDQIAPGSDYAIASIVRGIMTKVVGAWKDKNGKEVAYNCQEPGNSVIVTPSNNGEIREIYNAIVKQRKLLLFSHPTVLGSCGNIGTTFDYINSQCVPSKESKYGVYTEKSSLVLNCD